MKKRLSTPNCPFCCCFCHLEFIDALKKAQKREKMKKNQEIVEIFANLPETCEFEPFLPQETGESIVILMENDKTDNVGVEDAEKEVDATHLHPPNSPPPKIIERTESNSFSRLSMESSSPEMIESNSDDEKTLLGNSGQFDNGKTYKMVFLGNSGMEKTAMMNGFVNYLKWPRFEDAADAKMEIRIPMEFKLQEEAGTSPMIAKTNSDSENERFNNFGEFVTQKPLTEVFRIGKDTFEILDTPETSDTCRFGQENLKMIQEVLENESELHGICIFLDPNKTDSEWTLRQILALFPKKAVGNMFFFLPSNPDLGFCNSDSISPFKQFVAEIVGDADFDNFFIVDHEAFKHFVAENGHKNYNKKQLKFSWEKTAENVRRFLELLEKVQPIRGDEITFWQKMGAKTKELFDRTSDLTSIPDDLTDDLGRLVAAVVQGTFPLDAGSYTDWLGDEREPAKLEEVENLLEKLAAKLEAFY